MRKLWILTALAAAIVVSSPVHAANEDHPYYPEPFAAPQAVQAIGDSIAFGARVFGHNLVGMTITNYGFIGNNFTSRSPSLEYPLGSGYEHLVRGGLWVGSVAADDNGAFIGVSAGGVDGSQGGSAAAATEFTPAGLGVTARSTLPNSVYFSRDAKSENDFISFFSDRPAKKSIEGREDHRPLGILVRQENYQWAFSSYNHFAIFHYVITNQGPPLRDVYVGLYNEMISVNKGSQSIWPAGGIFSKKEIGWVDSLNMFTERFCRAGPVSSIPANCFYSICPPLMGLKLLGVKPGNIKNPLDKKVTLASWSYSPGSAARDEDAEKYSIMSSGEKVNLSPIPDSLGPVSGDPVELLAVGPFSQLNTGDSVSVDFAYLGSGTADDLKRASDNPSQVSQLSILIDRARVAQKAYDLDYVVPVPPPSPRFKVVARDHALDYYWDDLPEATSDPTSTAPGGRDFEGYRIYLGEDRNSLGLIQQFDLAAAPHDTTGFNTGFSAVQLPAPVVIDGITYRYKYTIDHLRDGFKYFAAVTSYDLGTTEIESLESGQTQNEVMAVPAPAAGEGGGVTVFPNPYRVEASWDSQKNARDHYLWFANLPERCMIRLYTLSGDLVYEYDFDGATYTGANARGVYNPSSDLKSTLSGRTFGWDMITKQGQAAATGLYMWSVEDKSSKKRQLGKFLIVKSDRETF
jgi:hypothetical protein